MMNEFGTLYLSKGFWKIVFLSLFLAISGCDNRDGFIASESPSEDAAEPIGEEDVLAQAKLFLHLLRGTDAKDFYDDPDRPPVVVFNSDRSIWHVSFGYPLGAINIQLDVNAKRGNYTFRNGAVIRKDGDQNVDAQFPPLYSLEEMEELFQLPNNRWAVD